MAHKACRACPLATPPGTHLLPTDRACLSTARCPPQKPALPSLHSSSPPPQSNLCSEVRDATSGPHCLCTLYLHSICLLTVRRQSSVVSHFCTCCKPGTHCPSFFSAWSFQECLCSKEPGRQRKYLPLEQGQASLLPLRIQLPCTLGSQLCDSPAGCSSRVPVRVGTQETGTGQRGPVVAAPAGKQSSSSPTSSPASLTNTHGTVAVRESLRFLLVPDEDPTC